MEKILDKKFGRRGFLKAAAAGVAAALTLDNTSYDVKAVQEELVNQGALI